MTQQAAALWVKSNFSFLEGASHPDELIDTAHARGLSALALTDRDGVYGLVRAHVAAQKLGFRMICGAQITIGDPDDLLGTAPVRPPAADPDTACPEDRPLNDVHEAIAAVGPPSAPVRLRRRRGVRSSSSPRLAPPTPTCA